MVLGWLTQIKANLDTALDADSTPVRTGGHGHVYAQWTRACGSGAANALDATDLETRRPGSAEWIRAGSLFDSFLGKDASFEVCVSSAVGFAADIAMTEWRHLISGKRDRLEFDPDQDPNP